MKSWSDLNAIGRQKPCCDSPSACQPLLLGGRARRMIHMDATAGSKRFSFSASPKAAMWSTRCIAHDDTRTYAHPLHLTHSRW